MHMHLWDSREIRRLRGNWYLGEGSPPEDLPELLDWYSAEPMAFVSPAVAPDVAMPGRAPACDAKSGGVHGHAERACRDPEGRGEGCAVSRLWGQQLW